MTRELIVRITCDALGEDHLPTSATTRSLTIDGEAREVDLCDECAETLLAPLLALMRETGRPITATNAPGAKPATKRRGGDRSTAKQDDRPVIEIDGQVTCPICRDYRARPKTMWAHMRNRHDQLPDGRPTAQADYNCTRCGFGANDRRGLAAHARKAHDLTLAAIEA